MSATEKPRRPAASSTLAVAFTVFLDMVGFGMILPLLPFYASGYGASPFQIGLLFASFSLAQFAASPYWGRLSDRVGRRRPLLVSILLGVVAYLLLAVAPTLLWVFVARLLAGAAAANYTIAQAWMADATAPEERAKAMGWLGAAFGLGFVVGPALGGGLSHLGEAAVPIGAAVLAVLNFGLVWRSVPETRSEAAASETKSASVREILGRSGRLPLLVGLYGVVIFGFSAMEATLALFCERELAFGIRKTALLFVFVGLLMVLVQGALVGRLVARFGESRLLAVGLGTMAAGMLLLPGVHSLGRLAGAAALLAVGSALYNPSAFSLMSRSAPVDAQGSVLGVARSVGALARVGGPVWGGWAFHRLGITVPFLSAGALLVLAGVCAVWLHLHYAWPDPVGAGVGETA